MREVPIPRIHVPDLPSPQTPALPPQAAPSLPAINTARALVTIAEKQPDKSNLVKNVRLPSLPAPEDDGFETAKAEAKRINDENTKNYTKYTPAPNEKKMLVHVIAESILPDKQAGEGVLNRLESYMRNRDSYHEKIVSLSVENPDDPEEFMKELEKIKARESERYEKMGYKVIFDVACPRQDLVAKVQGLGMGALAFTREGQGDIIQPEGIMMALRALQSGSIENLRSVFKSITGRDLVTDKTDIAEIAREIPFVLPVTKLHDVNDIGKFNEIAEENIENAA